MTADVERIRRCLERYGEALSVGDVAAVAGLWEVPALVLSDQGAIPVADRSEIEDFFARAVGWYHSQGLMTTRPELERVAALSDRLVSVDVRWPAFDEAGTEKTAERSHYILRLGDDDRYRVQVALTITTGT